MNQKFFQPPESPRDVNDYTVLDVAKAYEEARKRFHPGYQAFPSSGLTRTSKNFKHFEKALQNIISIGTDPVTYIMALFANGMVYPHQIHSNNAMQKVKKYLQKKLPDKDTIDTTVDIYRQRLKDAWDLDDDEVDKIVGKLI